MPVRLAVVCEARADFQTATELAERVVRERVDWVVESLLAHCPLWIAFDSGHPFLTWREVPTLARHHRVRAHGHFAGQPGEPDARAARLAILLVKLLRGDVEGFLLIRDSDGDVRRLAGLSQAREQSSLRERVAIGVAHCKREAWVLAGFDPRDEPERERLESVRAELGFDPRTDAALLTSKSRGAKNCAKRVLAHLTAASPDREASCWRDASLVVLRERGRDSGLTEYLTQIETLVVPSFRRPSADDDGRSNA